MKDHFNETILVCVATSNTIQGFPILKTALVLCIGIIF